MTGKRFLQAVARRIELAGAVFPTKRRKRDAWLEANRRERMDANSPLFDAQRREFHLARYRFAASRLKGMSVADIACGTGYGASHLRAAGCQSVVGIDIEPQAIAYARSTYGGAGVEFRCAGGEDTGLQPANLDAVVSFETIEHVADDEVLLNEFHRVIRPGGILIVSTPNEWPLTEHHRRSYSRESFEKTLSAYFNVEQLFNQNSGVDWVHNHAQAAGIVPTDNRNSYLAECYIAVCNNK